MSTRDSSRRWRQHTRKAGIVAITNSGSGRTPFHALDPETTAKSFSVDLTRGLDSAEATARLERWGPNQLPTAGKPTWLQLLTRQFKDALVLTLVVAAFVSGVVLGNWIDATVILIIVFLNAVIGFSQELKAAGAAEGLRELTAPYATVIRENVEVKVPTETIVPGDLIRIEGGDRVSADGRLVEAIRLSVAESELTGESVPTDKTSTPVAVEAPIGDRSSMVFSGTTVAAGHGIAIVTATGTATEIGRIAELLSEDEPPTPLEKELNKVGRRIGVLAVGVAIVVFGIGIAQGKPTESMFLLAVALAVAAIPEGLPAVVGITLGRGVQDMARRNAIVRRLPAVEALGAVTVICTDKTGTLTKNEIWVQETEMAALRMADPATAPSDPRIARYAELAVLCNDARRSEGTWLGDPTEIALLRSVAHLVDVPELRKAYPRIDEVPFDSTRKRMTTLHRSKAGVLLVVKGAPEVVVPMCTRLEGDCGVEPLDEDRSLAALSAAEQMAGRGLRTLALAYAEPSELPANLESAEGNLVLVALAGMRDELRPEARSSVEEAVEAGIIVVMITGDHEVTARTIAGDLGLLEDREVIGGRELAAMTSTELADRVERIGAYARVDPADKVKIVKAWQEQGAIVAMTGDGVNDAPALRSADIGVAMGSGTDVARDTSDIVLADDNFTTIVAAIRGGRTIFANLRKVIAFLLAGNVSEVLVVFTAFLMFGALGDPLLAVQLLWINLVTDGLPALALGFDPPGPGIMQKPPQRKRSLLGWESQLRLLGKGAIMATVVMAAFWIGIGSGYEWEHTRTLAFTTLVLVQMTYLFAVRISESGWRQGLASNYLVHGAALISVLLQVVVVMSPVGNSLFHTVPISLSDWTVAILLALGAALAVLAVSTFVPGMTDRQATDGT